MIPSTISLVHYLSFFSNFIKKKKRKKNRYLKLSIMVWKAKITFDFKGETSEELTVKSKFSYF